MQEECARLVILKPEWASESPGGLVKYRMVGLIPRVSDSIGLE